MQKKGERGSAVRTPSSAEIWDLSCFTFASGEQFALPVQPRIATHRPVSPSYGKVSCGLGKWPALPPRATGARFPLGVRRGQRRDGAAPALGGLEIPAEGSALRSAPVPRTMGGKKVCIVGSGNW